MSLEENYVLIFFFGKFYGTHESFVGIETP